MKIVYFAHSVLNRGGDKMVLAHLGHLAALGHQVVIRANRIDSVFAIHPAIAIEKPGIGSKVGTLFCAILDKQDGDCIIASIVPTALLLSLRNHGRVMHFAQDDNETAYNSPLLRYAIRFLYFLTFSVFAVPTITVSFELAKTFKKRFGAMCKVVRNGVDTKIFFPSPSIELLAAKEVRRSILLLSRSDPRKGFDIAREVVAQLVKTTQLPIEVWTVGEETSWDGISAIHRHFGNLDEASLRGVMSSADVFLYPSRTEGFPLMVLEAFACRCPVVTSTAIPYAKDNENALVSSVGDVGSLAGQVKKIIEDDCLAKKIADGGFRFAQENLIADALDQFGKEISIIFTGTAA